MFGASDHTLVAIPQGAWRYSVLRGVFVDFGFLGCCGAGFYVVLIVAGVWGCRCLFVLTVAWLVLFLGAGSDVWRYGDVVRFD